MTPTRSRFLGPPTRAVALGVVCGVRTFAAPGVAALRGRYGSGGLRTGLLVVAGGELVADKLPAVPARTAPPALLGRLASGAAMGATDGGRVGLASARGLPAAAGALGAGLSAYATQRLRAVLGEATSLPDPVLGLLEDLVVLVLTLQIMRCGDAAGAAGVSVGQPELSGSSLSGSA